MADAPSPVASSAAQASFQAKTTTDVREARRAGQAQAARSQAKTVTEEGTTVETTDSDVAVFTNSEGAGSQGRSLDSENKENSLRNEQSDDSDVVTKGSDGRPHVDLQV
ncbi:MAG: hypothetical protein HY287_13220 [Planctomycetes bacterium]|nr:hypothetical protein [Planctomycetota bacterium]MBI3835283.1 hypothetical protein [Planctomycetota bacterium]